MLVYNATVEAPLAGLSELLEKDELFSDFKAVREKQVYQLGSDMYQSAGAVAGLTRDFSRVLHGEEELGLSYLRRIE